MSDSRPIGIIDSGFGGLTVAKEIYRLMPAEQIVYLGDSARAPYGNRSDEAIQSFGLQSAEYLINMDIKMLIVACNTISAVALEQIEAKAKEVPVIGVVLPGARAAVLRTAEKKIGVIGTKATIRSGSYTRAVQSIVPDIKIYGKECSLFVSLVEEGLFDTDITRASAQYYLYELIDIGVDCIILGCTHYPLLMEVIQGTVGTRIQLLDSALWTAKEAQDILTALKSLSNLGPDGLTRSRFLFTDMIQDVNVLSSIFLGCPLPSIERISLEVISK
jgi:glutamate racemase